MPAAAAVAVGAAVGGSVISANAQKKAAGKAADTTLAAAQENNALTREIYGKNEAALSPFMQRGNVAGDYINAFLGLPTAPTTTPTTTPAPTAANGNFSGIVGAAFNSGMFPDVQAMLASREPYKQQYGDNWYVPWLTDYKAGKLGASMQTPATQTTAPQGVTQADAQNAFGNYIKNSDYGFQFATGSNAVNSGYAGAGTLQSGAAMKDLEEYRQNLQAGYRNEYMNALGNQQGVGLSATSALAGVGQNYVNSISANNNNAANAAANAYLVKGQSNPFAAGLGALSGTILGGGIKF